MNPVHDSEARVHRLWLTVVLALTTSACDGDPGADAGAQDAGLADAGSDAGSDAGTDAGHDADVEADAGVDAAIPPGACSNADDELALAAIDVPAEARACGTMCFGAAMCVTRCMEDHGLSSACATCFGAVAQCTTRNCALACSGDDDAACTACRVSAGCAAEFEACSGLAGT